jgi:(1->4)-alpha-D-glucan 1-alpha-D-glucosylmutase
LRLTAPGVPDLYQGCEFWDFSLVDPDNRRPVDYAARAAALDASAPADALLACWRDGRIKQRVIHRALALRARLPALFAQGSYRQLVASGPAAAHVFAFARLHHAHAAIALVTRLPAAWVDADGPRVDPSRWRGTRLRLPIALRGMQWTAKLGDCAPIGPGGSIDLPASMAGWPVQLLHGSPADESAGPG